MVRGGAMSKIYLACSNERIDHVTCPVVDVRKYYKVAALNTITEMKIVEEIFDKFTNEDIADITRMPILISSSRIIR